MSAQGAYGGSNYCKNRFIRGEMKSNHVIKSQDRKQRYDYEALILKSELKILVSHLYKHCLHVATN